MPTDTTDLAARLAAAAPELDWLRAPELVTIDGATFWRIPDACTGAVAAEALSALNACGFVLSPDPFATWRGCPRVVRA